MPISVLRSIKVEQVDPSVSAVATANGIYEFNLASLPSVGATTIDGPQLLAPKNILSSFQSGLSKLSRSSHSLRIKSLTTKAKLSSATLNSTSASIFV